MTRALAGTGAPRRAAPAIQRRPEDRWPARPVVGPVSAAMIGIVLASLAIHAGILLFATLGDIPPAPRPDITVELVQEPKPEPKSQSKADPKGAEKPAPEAEAPKAAAARPEPPKEEAEKPPEAKVDPPKLDPPNPKPEKPAQPDARRTQAEPKPVEPPKPPDAHPETTADEKLTEREHAMEQLKQELESLKAEQAALKAEETVARSEGPEPPAAQAPSMPSAPTIGGMPPSFAAVALPGLSEIDGIATGYQELVFSQLAKAKGIRRHMGVPGTTGVVFSVDRAGKLVKASIAHPSGSDALDKEALEIVMAAGPFPKPPPGSERTFSANFSFVPQAAP